jgi:hypothetical protein
MAKKSRAEVVDYVAKLIKSKPDISYADIVKDGRKAGYHVYPLIVGLAKNALGMGRPKKRGPGRPRGRKPGRPAGGGARRGRPPGAGRGITGDLLRGIERMQSDVVAMRSALRDIARLAARF